MSKGSWEVYPATEGEHPLDHYTCLTTHWRFPTNRGHSKEIHVNVRQFKGVRNVVDIFVLVQSDDQNSSPCFG